MIPYQRRLQMLKLLEENEIVSLEDFCRHLTGISESTVRRDLKTMEAEGQITMLRGGAARLRQGSYDVPVTSKSIKNVQQKEAIAKCAAGLVHDGESIYIDSGSTTLRILKYLRNMRVTIVTTNALIFSELQQLEQTDIQCYICGGEINASTASILGTTTNLELADKYFDKAFLGISGFSAQAGFNTPDIREAEKKQLVQKNAQQTYILADSSKDGRTTMCKIFDLGTVPVICDRETELLKTYGNYLIP